MTKNERIEKMAVKLHDQAYWSGINTAKSWDRVEIHAKAYFRNLARKLIRLDDKVKELSPKKTRKKFVATFRCGVCKSRLPKGATECDICGATDHDE